MKPLFRIIPFLALSISLSCDEPEPASISTGSWGTVRGRNADGTTFVEQFTFRQFTFEEWDMIPGSLIIEASQDQLSQIGLRLMKPVANEDPVLATTAWLSLGRIRESNKVSLLVGYINSFDWTLTFPIDPENTAYDLILYFGAPYFMPTADYVDANGHPTQFCFRNRKDHEVCFSYLDGSFLHVILPDRTLLTSSTPYDGMKWTGSSFLDPQGNDLSTTKTLPVQTHAIKNFIYDPSTKFLSFDYSFHVHGYTTSTGYDMDIEGHFRSK
jgi:hypothetical protein